MYFVFVLFLLRCVVLCCVARVVLCRFVAFSAQSCVARVVLCSFVAFFAQSCVARVVLCSFVAFSAQSAASSCTAGLHSIPTCRPGPRSGLHTTRPGVLFRSFRCCGRACPACPASFRAGGFRCISAGWHEKSRFLAETAIKVGIISLRNYLTRSP